MLKRRTLFILGAGASNPYGLPLASELSAAICYRDPIVGLQGILRPWCDQDYFSKADVKRFVDEFERSAMPSVDAFLERREEYSRIGKLAIATLLCQREHPGTPFDHSTSQNWYRALWSEMVSGAETPVQAIRNVSFVTFNYDRSLEHFLFHTIRHSFGDMDDAKAFETFGQIPIVHVYGSLGGYHSFFDAPNNKRPYDSTTDPASIECAARNIQLMPEGRNDECAKAFARAQDLAHRAAVICILGFGFDGQNMARLDLARILEYKGTHNEDLPQLVVSTYGKTKAQTALIVDALRGSSGTPVAPFERTNLDTLRESALIA